MRAPKKFRRQLKRWEATPLLVPILCRTPWKRVFSKQVEKAEAKKMRKEGIRVYPYQCACAWWHHTSRKQETISDSPEDRPDTHSDEHGRSEED